MNLSIDPSRPAEDPHRSWKDFVGDNDLFNGQIASPRPTHPPKTDIVRQAIARAIERYSANDVASVCESLGLEPAEPDETPMSGKYRYAMRRLSRRGHEDVLRLARAFAQDRESPELEAVLDALNARATGPDGQMRNLIFASNGPKPQIILTDAVDNQIQVIGNVDSCLVYDRPLAPEGLRWSDVIDWWASTRGEPDPNAARIALWGRLRESMVDSEPERMMFRAYIESFQSASAPALIPQVYLHYDPYTRKSGRHSGLVRERMDFLMLLPGRRRVVIEIDGQHHYSSDGRSDPNAYARMVSEDRRLRLSGYEVYRFGGQEFVGPEGEVQASLHYFFADLLADVIDSEAAPRN